MENIIIQVSNNDEVIKVTTADKILNDSLQGGEEGLQEMLQILRPLITGKTDIVTSECFHTGMWEYKALN